MTFRDGLLPADAETIEILLPDDTGTPVPTEAMPPGLRIILEVTFRREGSEENV